MKNPSSYLNKWKHKSLISACCLGMLVTAAPWRDASAALSFYAPYDVDTNLTVGTPSVPTDSIGTVGIVPGFLVNGMPSNAGDFSGSGTGLAYGNVSSYFTGATPSSAIGANTFRLMFKPNFSGTSVTSRNNLMGVGTLGATDSFYIFQSDDLRGPGFLMTSSTSGSLFLNALSNFNWSSSTWYYLGASFDNTGASLYVRALTNNSIGSFQSANFGGSATWGGNMGSPAWTVQVGRRAPIFGAGTEGANGLIDDAAVYSGERWTVAEFNHNFAVVIPEPGTAALAAIGAGLLLLRRRGSRTRNGTGLLVLAAAGILALAQPASATLSFYAPYDDNFDLTVGSFPQPTITNGTPSLTTGFALNGMPAGNALDVPGKLNGLSYKRVDTYFSGVGNGVTIGSNSFRLLYKPDYAGVQGPFELRKFIFGGGPLGSGDSFAIYHADGPFHGPTALFSIGNVGYGAFGLSNFNWSASTWYYMGVSWDSTGGSFYFRPMTNGASATIQNFAFGSSTWGASFLDVYPVRAGIRSLTDNEGAEGQIDDIKIFSSEKWSAADFHYDYAVIIPEPGSAALLGLVGVGIVLRRFRRERTG